MKDLGKVTNAKDITTKEYVDGEIPTKTSDLTNDSNFLPVIQSSPTNGQIVAYNGTNWVNQDAETFSQQQSNWTETSTASVQYIQNKPTIPTTTSQLTNDSGFITSSGAPVQSVNGQTGTVTITNITGNAATATKATQDGSGNVITTTYSTIPTTLNKYTITNIATDYTDFIIPLHSLDNTDINSNFYCEGVFYLKRSNSLKIHTRMNVISGKQYNSNNFYFNFDYVKDAYNHYLVKYLYDGKYYCGIYNKVTNASYHAGLSANYFYGVCSDYTVGSPIVAIQVYNNNTATVLNSEVYNSLETISNNSYSMPTQFDTIPYCPTAPTGTSTTQIATTAFVHNAITSSVSGNVTYLSSSQPSSVNSGDMWYQIL